MNHHEHAQQLWIRIAGIIDTTGHQITLLSRAAPLAIAEIEDTLRAASMLRPIPIIDNPAALQIVAAHMKRLILLFNDKKGEEMVVACADFLNARAEKISADQKEKARRAQEMNELAKQKRNS